MKTSETGSLAVNLERRIKKHIHAQTHTFEIDSPPGFSELCKRVAQRLIDNSPTEKGPQLNCSIKGGKVRIEGAPFELAYDLLLRGSMFSDVKIQIFRGRCSSGEKLKSLLDQISWELWIPSEQKIDWDLRVDSVQSRLYNESRIKQDVIEFLSTRFSVKKREAPLSIALDFRLQRETLEIYVSLGGRTFFQKGQKQSLQHAASLREDIAACLVQRLAEVNDEWNSKKRPTAVVNPFCGTGTLLHESALLLSDAGHLLSKSDHWACHALPFFKANAFRHRQKTLQNSLKEKREIETGTIFYRGEDTQEPLCRASLDWFEHIPLKDLQRFEVQISKVDSCERTQELTPRSKNALFWLLANPPFGIRLNNANQTGVEKTYRDFAERILHCGTHAAKENSTLAGVVLCPSLETWTALKKTLQGWRQCCEHFTLGGLDIRAFYFSSRTKKS